MKSYDDVVRENFIRIRRERFGRQEDLAAAANEVGLDWTQSTVAGIETGRRHIGDAEWLLLQSLISPREVRRHDGPVRLNEHVVLQANEYALAVEMFAETDALAQRFRAPGRSVTARKAEARLARKLQIAVDMIDAVAHRLWGRGLAAERDRRLKESGAEVGDRMRAAWITRDLERELRTQLG